MKKSAKKSKPKSAVKTSKSSAQKTASRSAKQNYAKPLFILVLILLLVFGYMYKAKHKQEREAMYNAGQGKISANQWLSEMLMKSNTMNVPEVTPAVEVSMSKKTTEFEGGTVTLGDMYSGDKEHIFTTVAVSTGGTGEFIYLVAFDHDNDTYKMTASVPLGDRVVVDSLMAEGSIVTVSYRTHGEDQPMAEEPNLKMLMKFMYADGKLTEVKE
jgi:hypothetical protein